MAHYVKMLVESASGEDKADKQAVADDFILIEVDDRQGGGLASVDEAMGTVPSGSFEKAVAKLGPVARAVLAQVEGLGLSEVHIELGIKFTADVGIILAKSSGEGSCKVTIGWKKDEQQASNSKYA